MKFLSRFRLKPQPRIYTGKGMVPGAQIKALAHRVGKAEQVEVRIMAIDEMVVLAFYDGTSECAPVLHLNTEEP